MLGRIMALLNTIGHAPVVDDFDRISQKIASAKGELRAESLERWGNVQRTISLHVDAAKLMMTSQEAELVRQIQTVDSALREVTESHFNFTKEQIGTLTVALRDAQAAARNDVENARLEAQTANAALQKLLEAALASYGQLVDTRFTAQKEAIFKVDQSVVASKNALDAQLSAAVVSAKAAFKETNAKGEMRSDNTALMLKAMDERYNDRLKAVSDLIDLRARMHESAVQKAAEANEKRFESVNSNTAALSERTRDLVTQEVLTARAGQLSSELDSLDRQTRISFDGIQATITALGSRLDRGEGAQGGVRQARQEDHSSIGSTVGIIGGIVGILTLVTIITLGIINHSHDPPINPTIGADTKRVDDLINRLDSLSRRVDEATHPVIPAR
jgi:hypothetical protein